MMQKLWFLLLLNMFIIVDKHTHTLVLATVSQNKTVTTVLLTYPVVWTPVLDYDYCMMITGTTRMNLYQSNRILYFDANRFGFGLIITKFKQNKHK